MGLQGYVGSGEDVRRIRRQEQQLEEERTNREAEKQQRDANVSAAGFRQFGKGAVEVSKRLRIRARSASKIVPLTLVFLPDSRSGYRSADSRIGDSSRVCRKTEDASRANSGSPGQKEA